MLQQADVALLVCVPSDRRPGMDTRPATISAYLGKYGSNGAMMPMPASAESVRTASTAAAGGR